MKRTFAIRTAIPVGERPWERFAGRHILWHPVYGPYICGWRPVFAPYGHLYDVNEHSQVRNRRTGCILKPNPGQQVGLVRQRDGATVADVQRRDFHHVYKIALQTFFPLRSRHDDAHSNDYTVEHMNQCYTDNNVMNLEWLPRGENTRRYTMLVRKNFARKPRDSMANLEKSTAGAVHELPGERWFRISQTYPLCCIYASDKVQVSNMGRLRMSDGRVTLGSREGRHSKYRVVTLRVKNSHRVVRIRVHQLVYMACSGTLAPSRGSGHVIMHSDTHPLDEDGCYSNCYELLKVGTLSENTTSWHRARQTANAAMTTTTMTTTSLFTLSATLPSS